MGCIGSSPAVSVAHFEEEVASTSGGGTPLRAARPPLAAAAASVRGATPERDRAAQLYLDKGPGDTLAEASLGAAPPRPELAPDPQPSGQPAAQRYMAQPRTVLVGGATLPADAAGRPIAADAVDAAVVREPLAPPAAVPAAQPLPPPQTAPPQSSHLMEVRLSNSIAQRLPAPSKGFVRSK